MLTKTLLLTSFLMTCTTICFGQVTTQGLIGWYSFSGNANDRSGNAYHGTVTSASLTNDRFGFSNNAYNYDGNADYIVLGNSFDVMPRTISLWFKASTIGSLAVIFSIDNNSLTKGLVSFGIMKIGGNDKIILAATGAADTADVTANAWHNAIVVVDTGFAWFYLDNTLTGKVPYSSFIHSVDGNANATVGTSRGLNNRYFEGAIDDIRIYNRHLSNSELTALSNETGIRSVTAESNISVYPNPNSGLFNMDISAIPLVNGYLIKVINSTGQEVYASPISGSMASVDLGNIGSGLYLINVVDALGNVVSRKKVTVLQ